MNYPELGKEFELTLTKEQCDPIAMVKNFGYNPKGWKYNGKIPETLTIKCKLVKIGDCSDLDEAKKKLEKLGEETPSGLFMKPFKDKYPEPDGNGPIGIADSSWVHPDGSARFPYVRSVGDLRFNWTDYDLLGHWRWLVLSK